MTRTTSTQRSSRSSLPPRSLTSSELRSGRTGASLNLARNQPIIPSSANVARGVQVGNLDGTGSAALSDVAAGRTRGEVGVVPATPPVPSNLARAAAPTPAPLAPPEPPAPPAPAPRPATIADPPP